MGAAGIEEARSGATDRVYLLAGSDRSARNGHYDQELAV